MSGVVNLGDVTFPVARKDHLCNLCFRKISRGEKHSASRHVYDGRAYTWRVCAHCDAFMSLTSLGGYLIDVGWEEGYGRDDVANFEPSNRRECVLKSQWSRGWRNYAGTVRVRHGHYLSEPEDSCPLVPVPS